jgi:hypothetical protein
MSNNQLMYYSSATSCTLLNDKVGQAVETSL